MLDRNMQMISLENRSCDYPVLSVHGETKTVSHACHANINLYSFVLLKFWFKFLLTYKLTVNR